MLWLPGACEAPQEGLQILLPSQLSESSKRLAPELWLYCPPWPTWDVDFWLCGMVLMFACWRLFQLAICNIFRWAAATVEAVTEKQGKPSESVYLRALLPRCLSNVFCRECHKECSFPKAPSFWRSGTLTHPDASESQQLQEKGRSPFIIHFIHLEQLMCSYLRCGRRRNILNMYQMFILIWHEVIYWKRRPFRSWADEWPFVGNFNYSELVNINLSVCAFCSEHPHLCT